MKVQKQFHRQDRTWQFGKTCPVNLRPFFYFLKHGSVYDPEENRVHNTGFKIRVNLQYNCPIDPASDVPSTARPRDTRILVPGKNRAAQNRAL